MYVIFYGYINTSFFLYRTFTTNASLCLHLLFNMENLLHFELHVVLSPGCGCSLSCFTIFTMSILYYVNILINWSFLVVSLYPFCYCCFSFPFVFFSVALDIFLRSHFFTKKWCCHVNVACIINPVVSSFYTITGLWTIIMCMPVSYTHLDVYKRQI